MPRARVPTLEARRCARGGGDPVSWVRRAGLLPVAPVRMSRASVHCRRGWEVSGVWTELCPQVLMLILLMPHRSVFENGPLRDN